MAFYSFTFEDILPYTGNWLRILEYKGNEAGITPHAVKWVQAPTEFLSEVNEDFIINVYDQAFVCTATNTNLDKHGERYGIGRGNLTDEEYRIIIKNYLSLTRQGAVTQVIVDYLESIGYIVIDIQKGYEYKYNTEDGHNTIGDNSVFGNFIHDENLVNFTTFFYVDPAPADSAEAEFLTAQIRPFQKVNNFIFVR